ncbi:hydrogenase nickel incorporation protein HypB [Telmatospirillum sp.]|uniref:hydrogenase nickel incorporation protein HypB n=1 Tax=Telmatospirillum sp. TaxID=2079197 RepID=UPI0028518B14|nr:hydrogenase nickel incorporation protein HypB [Telmatospirillum sp.]MDR3440690.1 hydrogenase nickel incorporation protein HypB [Telmatospirillum sp.]
MCKECGCDSHVVAPTPGPRRIDVVQNLLSENDHQALHNQEHFDAHGVIAINLMSSPGSGKTSLLEATIEALAGELRIAVIEGDLETENDALRIRRHGVPAVQITTGMACHLDAGMVHDALHHLDLDDIDLLFIENVGNLVCPAGFALGQHADVVLLSATEGDDKPAKYPVIFRQASRVLITKADLLPYLGDFDPARAAAAVHRLAADMPIDVLSAKSGAGMDGWLGWLRTFRRQLQPLRRSVSHK